MKQAMVRSSLHVVVFWKKLLIYHIIFLQSLLLNSTTFATYVANFLHHFRLKKKSVVG